MKPMAFIYATVASLGVSLASVAAQAAGEHVGPIEQEVVPQIKTWLSDPTVIAAIREQNQKHSGLSQSDIDSLDSKWRQETKGGDKPMITAVLDKQVSKFLQKVRDDSQGVYTEIFVMDNKGLNVGQSDMTSDFWQGDEAKWQKTYQAGTDAMLIDEVEFDESTQTYQSQVSLPVVDPDNGSVIGAVTVGVNIDALQ